ncbi:hypothetical protein ACFQ4C_13635 [Larkinella insperata]|uniref:Uncharacterized protein n=1 Tax=Larkinella insperata TaxID=332158 RepID=A0ABW3Q9Q1_9BACT|nr:hypothetical protein [Larkinella insperata]
MKNEKIEQGKNGLRNYGFSSVQKNKEIDRCDYRLGIYTEVTIGMFYKKKCLYCENEFEARRVDASFCCQSCQKAHLRLRKKATIKTI